MCLFFSFCKIKEGFHFTAFTPVRILEDPSPARNEMLKFVMDICTFRDETA